MSAMMDDDAFDISALEGDPDLIAAVVPRDGLFGLLSRTVRVPSGWVGLVVGREGDRTTVPAGGEIEAADTAEVVFVRTGPVSLAFQADSVSSSDGYLCAVSLRLSVALSSEAADLTAFRSAVMGAARQATSASLCEYLQDDVRRGLVGWGKERRAEDLVDGLDVEALESAIRGATEPACFSAGMRLTGEVTACFTSSGVATVRSETERTAVQRDRLALQRQLREAAGAARREHLEHVEQMLARLQEMAEASPGVSVGELVRQFGEDQRGQLYRSLSRCASVLRRCESVVVAAGDDLVWLDPGSPERPTHRQRVDVPGGAVRSVRILTDADGRAVLAVGGATTVGLLDPSSGQVRSTLRWDVPAGATVRGGVNSVGIRGGTVLATHSELGVCAWAVETSKRRNAEASKRRNVKTSKHRNVETSKRQDVETSKRQDVETSKRHDVEVPDRGRLLLADMTRSAQTVRHLQTDRQGRVWLSIDEVVICLAGDDVVSAEPTCYSGSAGRITALTIADEEVFAGNDRGRVLRWPIDGPDACEVVYGGGAEPTRSVSVTSLMGIQRLGLVDDSDAVKELIIGDTVMERYVAGGDRLRQAWWSDDRVVAVNDHRNRLYVWSVGRPGAPSGTVDIGWLCSNRVQDVCLITTAAAT